MSAAQGITQCWFLAREIDERQDALDPVAKLRCLVAIDLCVSGMASNVPEVWQDQANAKADDIRHMIAAARQAIPPELWAAAVTRALRSGPSPETLSEYAVLFA